MFNCFILESLRILRRRYVHDREVEHRNRRLDAEITEHAIVLVARHAYGHKLIIKQKSTYTRNHNYKIKTLIMNDIICMHTEKRKISIVLAPLNLHAHVYVLAIAIVRNYKYTIATSISAMAMAMASYNIYIAII